MIQQCGEDLKPYVFSDSNYTPYSWSSTYTYSLILQGKDIYEVNKLNMESKDEERLLQVTIDSTVGFHS